MKYATQPTNIGITRNYGFRVVPHNRDPRVGMLKCPYCDSTDVTVEAIYPAGGGGQRVNNAFCEHCGHVGHGVVSRAEYDDAIPDTREFDCPVPWGQDDRLWIASE